MKKTINPIYLILIIIVTIGMIKLGKSAGYAKGRQDGYREAIQDLQAPTDSLRDSYIQARDSYTRKLDSLINEYDKK